jgi:hypothetical protein
MRSLKRLAPAVGLALAGCGGGGGGGDDDVGPDAEAPATRSATIAVTDIALTSPDGEAGNWIGGSITVEFADLTRGGGEKIYGDDPVGGCVVVRHDAAHPPHDLVDAGTVTIENAGPSDGLAKIVGPCAFEPGAGYQCVSHVATGQAAAASGIFAGVVDYRFPDQPLDPKLTGSYLKVDGFANPAFNSATPRPIYLATSTALTVIHPPVEGGAGEQRDDGISLTVVNGVGPIPAASAASGNFLNYAVDRIRIRKDADDDWPAIDFTVGPRGEGLTLARSGPHPHEFPATAQALTFTCSGDFGRCGSDGSDAPFEAMIVSGRTTDADVSATEFDFDMPAPIGTYATFECVFPLADTVVVPADAVAAILSTEPTRVEMRVMRVAGTTLEHGVNEGRILVGHALVGHTTLAN